MNDITEIKFISKIMAFTMVNQVLLSLFHSTQQHSKSAPLPKKDFVIIKVFISLHQRVKLSDHAFKCLYNRKIKLLWESFLSRVYYNFQETQILNTFFMETKEEPVSITL